MKANENPNNPFFFIIDEIDKVDKKKEGLYTGIIIITFVLLFIPIEKLAPNYDKYKTCYEYVEIDEIKNYEDHYPHYETYYIDNSSTIMYYVCIFAEDIFLLT